MDNQYGEEVVRNNNIDPNKVRLYKILIRILEFSLILIFVKDFVEIFKKVEETPNLLENFVLSDSCFSKFNDSEYLCFDDTYIYKVIKYGPS